MTTERLTQTALEQHDQILAKLQTGADTTTRQRKESLTPIKAYNQQFNRRESTRRISNVIYEQTVSQSERKESLTPIKAHNQQFSRRESTRRISSVIYEQTNSQSERKTSKSSLGTPTHPGAALFRVIQAARTWKRLSHRHQTIPVKPARQLENTYRLGPDPEALFRPDQVKVVIRDALSRQLRHFTYNSDNSKEKCLLISSEILSLVKQLGFQRYKIVCNVIIMQNRGQGSEVASRCIWDSEIDSSASLTHTTADIVCVASVHGVYFE